jgi:hypothetical protein
MLDIAKRADAFFMGTSPIHEAMARLTKTLREMNIPFAIAGAMAANAHGYHRTTADIDILISGENLLRFKEAHLGRGWVDKFEGSKTLVDSETSVDIRCMLAGEFVGSDAAAMFRYPGPDLVHIEQLDGVPYVTLNTLLEMKIASGMLCKHRLLDTSDAIQLIRLNGLPVEHATQLNPYVADKYRELWKLAQVDDDY